MRLFKIFFCHHKWYKPFPQNSIGNGMFGLIRKYEFKCSKCGKITYSNYENIKL